MCPSIWGTPCVMRRLCTQMLTNTIDIVTIKVCQCHLGHTPEGFPAQPSVVPPAFLQGDNLQIIPLLPIVSYLYLYSRELLFHQGPSTKAPIRKDSKYGLVVIHGPTGFQKTSRIYYFYFSELPKWRRTVSIIGYIRGKKVNQGTET